MSIQKLCAITEPIVKTSQCDYFGGNCPLLAIKAARSAEIVRSTWYSPINNYVSRMLHDLSTICSLALALAPSIKSNAQASLASSCGQIVKRK